MYRGATPSICLRDVRALVFSVAIGLVAWIIYAVADHPWRAVGDDTLVADVARHIAQGRGITTGVLFPPYVGLSADSTPTHLNPYPQSPGYPLVLALAFKLGEPTESTAYVVQTLLFVALLLLTYTIARRFVEPGPASLIVILVALEPQLLVVASFIGNDLLFAVLVSLALATSLWSSSRSARWQVAAGATLAVAYLVRPNALVLVPAFALMAAFQYGSLHVRLRRAFAIGLPSLVMFAAYGLVVPNYAPVQSSLHFLYNTASFPGASAATELSVPSPLQVLTIYLPDMIAKVVAGIRYYLGAVASIGTPLITGGVLFAMLILARHKEAKGILVYAVTGTIATVLIAAAVEFSRRPLIFLLPVYLLLIVWALRRYAWYRPAVAIMLSIALATYVGEVGRLLRDQGNRIRETHEVEQLVARVKAESAADDWIATDIAALLTWHTGLSTVNLPRRVEDLEVLSQRRRPITTVVVTSITVAPQHDVFRDRTWLGVLEGGSLPGFVTVERFSGSYVSAVILRRPASR